MGKGNGSLSLSNEEFVVLPENGGVDDGNIVEYDEFELDDIESLESIYDAMVDASNADMPLEVIEDIKMQMVQCYLESLQRLAHFGDKVDIFELASAFNLDIYEAILEEFSPLKKDDKPKE